MGPHSYFPGAVTSRTIRVAFAVLAAGLLANAQAFAQDDLVPSADPETPFTQAYNSGYSYRGSAIRMSYESPTYGLHNDQFSLGLQNRGRTGDGVVMLDGQYDLNLEHTQIMGLDVGLGRRWLYQSSFSETARIFGASFWYDGCNTEIDNMFNQVGFSLESLGEMWDLRVNGNFVVGTSRKEGTGVGTGEISYAGYYLSEMTLIPIDQAVSNVDFEIARRIGAGNVWAWAGGYGLWEDDTDDSAFGGKAGVRGYVYDDLMLQLGVTSDEMFDTKVTFSLIWYPGRSSRKCRTRHSIDDRLMEPVIRNNYIAIKRDQTQGGNPLEYEDGELIRVVHVDSNATGTGDGTFESPFTSLDSVFGGSQNRDIVLVHSDTTYTDQQVVLRDNQRLLGEGNNIRHYVDVKDIGSTALPETSTGSLAGAIPLINNTTGDVVTLGTAETSREYDDDETYSTNEVNNLTITGGTRGIVSSAVGIGEATIKNMTIQNLTADTATDPDYTGNGIELTPYVQTIVQEDDSETKQVLFSPTINTVTLKNVEGDGINIDASASVAASTTRTESIKILNVTSTSTLSAPATTGQGINITKNKSAATIDNFVQDGGVTAAGGILFTESTGGATITNSEIENGIGTGISIAGDSSGSFTIDETTITNTGAAGVNIDGGTSDVTFTGRIAQTASSTGAAVSVTGDHDGTVNFNEAEEDQGVILVTNGGTGLVFGDSTSGADGTYNFNDGVEINGVTTGIDIQDSDGSITLSDALVEDASTAAVQIDGGDANLSLTGQIVQTTNGNGSAFSVSGGHSGTVSIAEGETSSSETGNGAIVATYGSGLQFDDADGGYTFSDKVDLSGNMTAGINITNDSNGLFTFSDTDITNITGDTSSAETIKGVAFNLNGGTATVNFTGKITQTANSVTAVQIAGDHETGTVNFNAASTDEDVIVASTGDGLRFGTAAAAPDPATGANGTYNFNGGVALSGTTGIDVESSNGTITFDDATVTDSSITALSINGGSANVNFTGLITNTSGTTGATINVTGNHDGDVVFNEAETDTGVVAISRGAGLVFNGADGTYTFNDNVTLNGEDTSIDIDDSDGDITFGDANVTNTDNTIAVLDINGGSANVNFTGQITKTSGNGAAVRVTGGHDGTVSFTESTSGAGVVVASSGTGLQFGNATTGADGSYTFNDAVTLSGTTAAVNIQYSDGAFSFNGDSSIAYNGSGTAFTVQHGEATVTYGGDIDSTSGRPVSINDNSGGLVTFTGTIDGDANGILVQNNTGGTFQFTGSVDLDTTTNDAVYLDNNTGATISFSNLNATTTTGTGFYAHGGGTVQVTGSNNTIETTGIVTADPPVAAGTVSGSGIDIDGVAISSTSGVTFSSVSVGSESSTSSTTKPEYGIVLNDITGGTFTVNGGTIENTNGVGVSITNAASVALNNMTIDETTGHGISLVHDNDATFTVSINNCNISNTDNTTNGAGINLDATGSGTMTLSLDDNTINDTGLQGINLAVSDDAERANISVNNNEVTLLDSNTNEAVLLTVSDIKAKTVNFEAIGNELTNDCTESTLSIQANGTVTLNATVHSNLLTNNSTISGRAFEAATTNLNADMNLSLLGNTGEVGTGNTDTPFLLNKTAGSFGVVLLETPDDDPKIDEVNKRNGGTGTYADYTGGGNTPADVGWVIEFLPDASPLTPPKTLGFTNLSQGSVPTP